MIKCSVSARVHTITGEIFYIPHTSTHTSTHVHINIHANTHTSTHDNTYTHTSHMYTSHTTHNTSTHNTQYVYTQARLVTGVGVVVWNWDVVHKVNAATQGMRKIAMKKRNYFFKRIRSHIAGPKNTPNPSRSNVLAANRVRDRERRKVREGKRNASVCVREEGYGTHVYAVGCCS